MLTRLKVNGFKNLADVDVSFGPFTCVAGVNGVGKSNLFDAITFLSALADKPLMDAAKCVRDERNRSTDVRSLFLALGNERHLEEISFEAEMLVPRVGHDDLGQPAEATITFLRYGLVIGYRRGEEVATTERLEVKKEELSYVKLGEAPAHLRFPHSMKWRESVVKGRRFADFLSTEGVGQDRVIKLHQDGTAGRPRSLLAANLPRTVISSTNALESPTALLARREMQSWRLLQLEPSALRASDPFTAPTRIGADGSHLAATLHHLAKMNGKRGSNGKESPIYARVANRLSELINDVRAVEVDEDEKRELLTLRVMDSDRRLHAARALSDGTLRFLALSILELDPDAQGLLCFEEPENGIHPDRVSAMLRLLNDLAVDTDEEVGPDNPLRQIIVNTHSPSVVGKVSDGDLLVAEPHEALVSETRVQAVRFTWLNDTWRCKLNPDSTTVSRGRLRAYLNPLASPDDWGVKPRSAQKQPRTKRSRVMDRDDLQLLLPTPESE